MKRSELILETLKESVDSLDIHQLASKINVSSTKISGNMNSLEKSGKVTSYMGSNRLKKYSINRDYVPKPKKPRKKRSFNITGEILDYIFQFPGCTQKNIFKHFESTFSKGSITTAINRKVNQGVLKREIFNDEKCYEYIGEPLKDKKVTSVKKTYVSKPQIDQNTHDVIDSISTLISQSEGAKQLLIDIRDQINNFLGENK